MVLPLYVKMVMPLRGDGKYIVRSIDPTPVPNCPLASGCPQFVVDTEICLALSPASSAKMGRTHSKPLRVYPKASKAHGNRWDLYVHLRDGNHVFCRLVAFTFLKYTNTHGKSSHVVPSKFRRYQANHTHAKQQWDCTLRNLEILTIQQHAKLRIGVRHGKRPAAA